MGCIVTTKWVVTFIVFFIFANTDTTKLSKTIIQVFIRFVGYKYFMDTNHQGEFSLVGSIKVKFLASVTKYGVLSF